MYMLYHNSTSNTLSPNFRLYSQRILHSNPSKHFTLLISAIQ